MGGASPRVSFGLFVRNGAHGIRRCLDSILSQDLGDLEIVVSDNASSDETPAILREYAAQDSRVRPFLQEENLGLIENANRVFHESQGEFFRWIGAEDWLSPTYASRCIAELDADPDLVAVTSFFSLHYDTLPTRNEEYDGELLEAEDPARRFRRMLWTFHAGDGIYDPIYAMFRRERLARTGLIRRMVKADQVLAAELALLGRFVHVQECLAHRWKPEEMSIYSSDVHRRYDPVAPSTIPQATATFLGELMRLVATSELAPAAKLRCRAAIGRLAVTEYSLRARRAGRRFRRDRLGLTRERLGLGQPERRA